MIVRLLRVAGVRVMCDRNRGVSFAPPSPTLITRKQTPTFLNATIDFDCLRLLEVCFGR